MQVETFQYDLKNDRWSVDKLPELDSDRTLILAFGASEIHGAQGVLKAIRAKFPKSHILGCSTAGEVLHGELRDGTLSAAVVRFDHTALRSAAIIVRHPDHSHAAGEELGSRLVGDQPVRAVILLSEGLQIDAPALVAGMQSRLGADVPIVGAMAADSHRYERTWVWSGDTIQSGLCAAVAFAGPEMIFHSALTQEWGEPGPTEFLVTKADRNVVFRLGERPALEVCRAVGSGSLPLKVMGEAGDRVVSPLAVDEENKAIVFHEPVPVGARVQFFQSKSQDLIAGAAAAAGSLKATADGLRQNGAQLLALATSCAGRRVFLRNEAQSEMSSITESLTQNVPLVGLYAYGELSPDSSSNTSAAVRQSSLGVVLIGETARAKHASTPPPPRSRANSTRPPTRAMTPGARDSRPPARDSRPPTRSTRPPARSSRPPMPPPLPAPATDSGLSVPVDEYTAVEDQSEPETTVGSLALSSARHWNIELGAAHAAIFDLGGLRFITLSGTINETFDSQTLAGELRGRVVLDVAAVELITSFGVRGWLDMMATSESRLSALYLANCSEVVVSQMLMVRNFAGPGTIVSFGAPYICTVCSNTFEFLLDCEHAADEILNASPPDVACPKCGNRAVFDEDPEAYLEFVRNDVGKRLPADVRNAMAERRLDWLAEVDDSIEKRIEGERTVFSINRAVDEKIRWQRVLSGVEGIVRVDFTRATEATSTGAARFLAALRTETDLVSEILLDQVPLPIVEYIAGGEPIDKLTIRTLAVPARCANCGVVRQVSIDPAGIREARLRGLQPESECRRCSGSIPIALPEQLVAYFEGRSSSRGGAVGAGLLTRRNLLYAVSILAAVVALVVIINLLS